MYDRSVNFGANFGNLDGFMSCQIGGDMGINKRMCLLLGEFSFSPAFR